MWGLEKGNPEHDVQMWKSHDKKKQVDNFIQKIALKSKDLSENLVIK